MTPQQYCLRWKYHHSNVQSMFSQLLEKERFCDVTLYCSPNFATQVPNKDTVDPANIRGVSLRAHRVVLAACSELLGTLLGAHEAQGEPVLVIDGAEPKHLKALLDYMYTGEMNVHHSQLASLLKTAEELRIKGLTDIRWNNKDEPPDCATGAVAATAIKPAMLEKLERSEPKLPKQAKLSPERAVPDLSEAKPVKEEVTSEKTNGGPPPLIKLPIKDKSFNQKRENSDTDSPSPKRQRLASGTENTDEESDGTTKTERDAEWQHGNLDITASRVVNWRGMESVSSRDNSDDEWADAPADIGSFLDTRLRVDGDNSADEESNESSHSRPSSTAASSEQKTNDSTVQNTESQAQQGANKATVGPKSGPTDPRFTDVIKLNDYLQHGRRPQFWEEHYVKRVMEAVRLKELEMKQAAEILGVSYGTLYGRYRDVYGCINRPYRAVRDFWQVKGPSEVIERLQRGEISLDSAATALGVSVANLAAHVADFGHMEFDPIPIEMDPSLRTRSYSVSSAVGAIGAVAGNAKPPTTQPPTPARKHELKTTTKRVSVGSTNDEESIPVSIITTSETKTTLSNTSTRSTGKQWHQSIRVANIDSLRSDPPASPSQLMKTRPDLTIVAAKKQDSHIDT